MIQKGIGRLFQLLTKSNSIDKLKKPHLLDEVVEKIGFQKSGYHHRLKTIQEYLKDCDDVNFVEFSLTSSSKSDSCIIYITSLTDDNEVTQRIIKPITNISLEKEDSKLDDALHRFCKEGILSIQYRTIDTYNEIINSLLSGDVIILSKHSHRSYAIPAKKDINYPISESKIETSILGPKTAFTNNLNVNIRLVRSYISSHKLKMKKVKVGKYTKSDVSVVYIQDLAPLDVVNDILNRIQQIEIDGILDTAYIQELIETKELSLFPQMLKTERVDRVVGNLLEGRIALLVKGSNSAAILPITINAFFQTPEDYYMRPFSVAFLRVFRYGAFLAASTATPLYVAFSIYHYEIIPYKLLVPFAESIAPIPFPPLFEAILLEIFAQILSESSSRMGGAMGPMIGILGAVLVGEAAVQAHLASPVLVITVAIGVVSSFSIPNYDFVMIARVIKFILIIFAGIF